MKKLFFTLVASLLVAANSFAQNSFAAFAALEHNGTLTTFTGSEALDQAIKAADDGDVITLSAGLFYAEDNLIVSKSLTLRGAGIDVNDGKNHTLIRGGITFDYRTNPDMLVMLEGIDFKNGIGTSADDNNPGNGQLNINRCIMYGCFALAKNVTINSSIIRDLVLYSPSFVICNNSIISTVSNNSAVCTYNYCIVYNTSGTPVTYEHCICTGFALEFDMANHCVFVDGVLNNFYTSSSLNTDITVVKNWSDVFNFEGENDAFMINDIDFLSKQNLESKIVTVPQVGIYGGLMPYSPVLALPSIKNITVAKQSDGEGKLSIDVEIED